jgi:hypothetical protein
MWIQRSRTEAPFPREQRQVADVHPAENGVVASIRISGGQAKIDAIAVFVTESQQVLRFQAIVGCSS